MSVFNQIGGEPQILPRSFLIVNQKQKLQKQNVNCLSEEWQSVVRYNKENIGHWGKHGIL